MKITFLMFDGYTALDMIGAYEVLARIPGAEVEFAAMKTGLIAADTRRLGIIAYRGLEDIAKTDILFVPGGPGIRWALENEKLVGTIHRLHETTKWTVGVCNGVELLGKAGLLKERTVTTNYFARENVTKYGANVVEERFVSDDKIITGAGVSASIDTALFVAAKLVGDVAAQAIQLGIEYYPSPPFSQIENVDAAPEFAKQIVKAFEGSGAEQTMLDQTTPFQKV